VITTGSTRCLNRSNRPAHFRYSRYQIVRSDAAPDRRIACHRSLPAVSPVKGHNCALRKLGRVRGGRLLGTEVAKAIRRLLIVGAMSRLNWLGQRTIVEGSWLSRMLARKPRILVAIALANKMARQIWAMLTKNEDYRDPALAVAA